jgi:hypothetical protein
MCDSYAFPLSTRIDQEPFSPDAANWIENNGLPMATLSYEEVRTANNPREVLLSFLESSYQAGGHKAG